MFATLAAWAGLAFVTGFFLRAHYAAPVVTSNPTIPVQAWVINQGWFKGGNPVSLDMMNQAFAPVDIRAVTTELWQPGPATPANLDPVQYLMQHGYTQLTTYQRGQSLLAVPVDRRWLAARALADPHRLSRVVGPPPRRLSRGRFASPRQWLSGSADPCPGPCAGP